MWYSSKFGLDVGLMFCDPYDGLRYADRLTKTSATDGEISGWAVVFMYCKCWFMKAGWDDVNASNKHHLHARKQLLCRDTFGFCRRWSCIGISKRGPGLFHHGSVLVLFTSIFNTKHELIGSRQIWNSSARWDRFFADLCWSCKRWSCLRFQAMSCIFPDDHVENVFLRFSSLISIYLTITWWRPTAHVILSKVRI